MTVQNQDSSTVPVAADPRDLTITAPVSGTALSGNIAVSVTGQARGVSLFALTLGEQKQFYIGEAAEGASDSWSFSWNTASFVDGEYEIYAKSAVIGGEEWMSPMVPVTIINGLVRPLTDTTLPVGLGSEYIILEESVATLVPVTDRGQEQTTLAADAEVVVLGNATITDLTLYKLNLSSVPGTEVFGGKVVVQGKGPANSTVIIKVFSEPIVASTTTDADGNWVYTLDSSLSRGDHEVYMTVSDKSSKTVGRSQLFSFLVNEAVAATDQVTDSVTTVAGSNRDLLEKYSYAVGGVIIVVLGLFLVIQRVAKKNNS